MFPGLVKIQNINDLGDKRLEPYQNCIDRRSETHIIEGRRLIQIALRRHRRSLRTILGSQAEIEGLLKDHQDKSRDQDRYPPIYQLESRKFKELLGFKIRKAIVAEIDPKTLWGSLDLFEPSPIVFLNGVTQAENVGNICRNALAFGIDQLIVDSKTCSPFNARALRVGSGAALKMKIYRTANSLQTLEQLRPKYRILASTPGRSKLSSVKPQETNWILIMGSEGHGIDPEILKLYPNQVSIPMNKKMQSINVSIAQAILLYELTKPPVPDTETDTATDTGPACPRPEA